MPSQHNQYGPGYDPQHVKHHEWRTAENSASHLIPRLQTMAQTNPKIQLLDVGAGSGTISASLAKYIPQGHVTATDISDDILSRAKQYAESKGVQNLDVQRANVYELPFPDSTFDVTHAHQVLCHLNAPSDAVKELVRVTKPGGVVALRESDMHMWCFWPELAGLLKFHEIQIKTLVANGGQDKGGRRLLSWVLQAGVKRDQVTASFGTWCYSASDDKQAWAESMKARMMDGQMREKAVQMGIATEREADEMSQAWDEWSRAEDATLGMMHGEILIDKV